MLFVDINGWINNPSILIKHRKAIEHAPIGSINAIVLHRTGTPTARSVLNAWQTQQEGTHFLISENGKIFQTASVKKQCWHVGKIYSRCRVAESCSEQEAKTIESMLHKKNTNWGLKFRLITKHELNKSYPIRYPHNHDSIGIEVVGIISKAKGIYETPNELQLNSLFWLLDELISTYSFSVNDIYAHGEIAHKDIKKSEGASSLKAYFIHKQGINK